MVEVVFLLFLIDFVDKEHLQHNIRNNHQQSLLLFCVVQNYKNEVKEFIKGKDEYQFVQAFGDEAINAIWGATANYYQKEGHFPTKKQMSDFIEDIYEKQTEKSIKDEFVDIDIDSFTMMLVITFADQELGVKLDMEKLDFDKFKSLNDLAKVIIDSK